MSKDSKDNLELELKQDDTEELCNRTVVRLITNMWSDNRGLHFKKTINFLKRQCCGFNIAEEDISNMGADFVIEGIVNLHSVKDGVYDLIVCNQQTDWETGYVEDYDYMLVPSEDN
jgi:hypothetical protein